MNILETYVDGTIRAIIGFLIIVVLFFIVNYIISIPTLYTLPFAILVGLLISPLLGKIKLGHVIIEKYDKFLLKITEKIKK